MVLQSATEENKSAVRKLRVAVNVAIAPAGAITARSLAFGREGVVVLAPVPLQPGGQHAVAFSLPNRDSPGKPVDFVVEASVVTSVLSGDGFKVDLRFLQPGSDRVQQLVRHLQLA